MTNASSEKYEKRLANRRLRKRVRQALSTCPKSEILPDLREVSSPWTMAKDGKRWYDPKRFPGVLRK